MKRWIYTVLFILLLLTITGCGKKSTTKSSAFLIYCLDTSETKLGSYSYKPEANDKEKMVEECLKQLTSEPTDLTLKKAIPDNVKVVSYRWNSDTELIVQFDSAYLEEEVTTEVLRRAAIVKTLCQIDEVEYVQFEVDEQPVMDSNGDAIGFMNASDFIDNTNSDESNQQTSKLSVYFADTSGESLVEIPIEITYDTTVSIEKLLIEQLISGPYSIDGVDKDRVLPTVPEDTKLLKISVKDSVCYVDLSSEFLEKSNDITNEVAVYSVVNSLVELPNINKVQFTIEGAQEAFYKDTIPFDQPLERNLDLVKETLR